MQTLIKAMKNAEVFYIFATSFTKLIGNVTKTFSSSEEV